ncbi:hypothetical protein [Vibrio cyclitrophicus]|uniref:hypothetical protein n=1 Tax=Vibrio cyclitrophicus TaxID=47951 RepID=UPI000C8436B3|nr:hypothetical protein [Vibrio cyclitrophicus]PME22296.1 hypothetical protein BCV41_21240 [Vibrio cyclitrophicus]
MRKSLPFLTIILSLLSSFPKAEANDCSFVKPTIFCGKECSANKWRKRCHGESYKEKNARENRQRKAYYEDLYWSKELQSRYSDAKSEYDRTGLVQRVCTSPKWTVTQPIANCPKSAIVSYPESAPNPVNIPTPKPQRAVSSNIWESLITASEQYKKTGIPQRWCLLTKTDSDGVKGCEQKYIFTYPN